MTLRDATDPRPVHFVGAGGAGMSALAHLLARRGINVTGCDFNPAAARTVLGADFALLGPHDASHAEGARALVVSSAIPREHPEILRARELGIPVIRRAEALGEVVAGGTVVGIAGTHGKTTTTAMTADALAGGGLDPTALVGARVSKWGGNLLSGGDSLFVVEADEYDRSFLALTPSIAVVTNVEADHLDIYRDFDEIRAAFERFLTPARTVILCADDDGAASLSLPTGVEVVRYGTASPDARVVGKDVRAAESGNACVVHFDGKALGELRIAVPGVHNVLNALAAVSCGLVLGVPFDKLAAALSRFAGTDRRFQVLVDGDIVVIDDYAHHPTEIAATLTAARSRYPGRRVIAAFQPHLFSRTRDFAPAFATSLAAADEVFLTEIYAARERPMAGVTSDLIADGAAEARTPISWRGDRGELAAALTGAAKSGDVIVLLGAGDITEVAHDVAQRIRR